MKFNITYLNYNKTLFLIYFIVLTRMQNVFSFLFCFSLIVYIKIVGFLLFCQLHFKIILRFSSQLQKNKKKLLTQIKK